jgi:RsiW-degrading membrane proteinase PrsW (M82 family)
MTKLLNILLFSLLPVITAIVLFHRLDKREKEPFWHILLALFVGAIAFLAERLVFRFALLKMLFGSDITEFVIRLNDEFRISDFTVSRGLFSAFIIGGLLKEGLKYWGFRWLARRIHREIDEPFDDIVYAVMTGLGFASGDLFFHMLINTPFSLHNFYGLSNLIIHITSSLVMGLCASFASRDMPREVSPFLKWLFNIKWIRNNKWLSYFFVFVCAASVHGAISFFISWKSIPGYSLGVILCLGAVLISRKVILAYHRHVL